MSDTESYYDEISKSFITESDKLEAAINNLLQKPKKFSIDEIISIYYQIMNVTSFTQFLKQNISNNNFEKTQILLEKIKLTENLIRTTFNTRLH